MYRGVTRLVGARGKKHVRTWDLSEANLLYWRKCLWHFWTFRRPSSDSAPGKLRSSLHPWHAVLLYSHVMFFCWNNPRHITFAWFYGSNRTSKNFDVGIWTLSWNNWVALISHLHKINTFINWKHSKLTAFWNLCHRILAHMFVVAKIKEQFVKTLLKRSNILH